MRWLHQSQGAVCNWRCVRYLLRLLWLGYLSTMRRERCDTGFVPVNVPGRDNA